MSTMFTVEVTVWDDSDVPQVIHNLTHDARVLSVTRLDQEDGNG